ncbi:MAG: TonB family protein [Limnobacter sp.]|nr:TonB family protein [Limnobacter sp.]
MCSLLVHSVFLAVQCTAPKPEKQAQSQLEVILVNAKSKRNPDDAKVLAQVGLDGGGQADEGRAQTKLSEADDEVSQRQLNAAQDRLAALEQLQRDLQGAGLRYGGGVQYGGAASAEVLKREQLESSEPGVDPKSQRALELKRLQAQIAENIRIYNERPRKHFFSPKTSPYEFAIYEEAWRTRVEQIGNQNYPPELKGKIYGKLRMTVYIKHDGSISDIEIDRSSGSTVLDRAAVKLLRMAAPFAPFPSDIRKKVDILAITRTWVFSRDTIRTEF